MSELICLRLEGGVKRVLDVGCGFGDDLVPLIGRNFIGFGIDFSFSQLKRALSNEKLGVIRFIQSEVSSLPFKSLSFDLVVFSEVIEHLFDARAALSEIRQVLKKEGVLFLTTPNRYDYFHFLGNIFPKSLRSKIKSLIQISPGIDSSQYSDEIEEHVHLYSLKELLKVVKEAGFETEEICAGRLRVPVPRLFDRYRCLQSLWSTFDGLLSRFTFSRAIKANFILVLKKKG